LFSGSLGYQEAGRRPAKKPRCDGRLSPPEVDNEKE
jgi:hypothetical protein